MPTLNYGAVAMFDGAQMPAMGPGLIARIIYEMADVAMILSPDDIVEGVMLGRKSTSLARLKHAVRRPLSDVLTAESAKKLEIKRASLSAEGDPARVSQNLWCELEHVLPDGETVPVRYSVYQLPDDGRFLLLGTDQRPLIELQQQLIAAQVAMEHDYENRREVDSRFRMLMETTRDAILYVSVNTRRILDGNSAAANLLGVDRDELSGLDFSHELEGITASELMDRALGGATDDGIASIEVLSRRTQKRLELMPRPFRAAGERLLIIRMAAAAAGSTATADPLDENLRQLYAKGVDGMVFTDREGVILSASESFLNLTDSPTLSSVKGRSLADFLARGEIDLRVLLENASRAGYLRLYPTRLKTDFDGQLPVEISATWINEGPEPVLALIVRDSARLDSLRTRGSITDDGVGNVMELVGSTPLKDIVADTTNIIEKLCIENAIELTRNNRVAAAEMLGLSRQSLYVKLRKYGLISRDAD